MDLNVSDVLIVNDAELNKRWFIHPFRFVADEIDEVKLDWENTEYIWINSEQIHTYQIVPGLYEAWLKVK
jgi:hypothetical protein